MLDEDANIPQHLKSRRISRLMYLIWSSRSDLRKKFDLDTAAGQKDIVVWFDNSAPREYPLIFDRVGSVFIRKLIGLSGEKISSAQFRLPFAFQNFLSLFYRCLVALLVRSLRFSSLPRKKSDIREHFFNRESQGVNLVGYSRLETGIGEHVRMSASSFKAVEAEFDVVDFKTFVPVRKRAPLQGVQVSGGENHRTNIFHINANSILHSLSYFGREFFQNRCNICYPYWELSRLPAEWVPALEIMDEIWAPSTFIENTISDAVDVNVRYMPPGVQLPPFGDIAKPVFGLPAENYTFLSDFDFKSFVERKNPWAVVSAFMKAFPDRNEKVTLVVKAMNGTRFGGQWRRLRKLADNDHRILFWQETLHKSAMLSIRNACDCYVSLHRAEGLGLGPLESMAIGKPVIVTNYSGTTDFAKPENSFLVDYTLIPVKEEEYPHWCGQVWADPDVEQAAWMMRRLFDNPGSGTQKGRLAKQFISQNFSPLKSGQNYVARLKQLSLI